MVLSGCTGLPSWDSEQSQNIQPTPQLATAGSSSQSEPGGQSSLLQHKENSEKQTTTLAYPDLDTHMNKIKGNHHEQHTNQHSGRKEVMSISSHDEEALISRDNLDFLVLGSIATILSITVALQWIFRCKGA